MLSHPLCVTSIWLVTVQEAADVERHITSARTTNKLPPIKEAEVGTDFLPGNHLHVYD